MDLTLYGDCTPGLLDLELRRTGVVFEGLSVTGSEITVHGLHPHVDHGVIHKVLQDHKPLTELGEDAFNCQECGACCLGNVAVTGLDIQRLPSWMPVNVEAGHTIAEIRCLALKGELGKSVGCSIYPQRPERCRLMRVGSIPCQVLRRREGIDG